MDQALRPVTFFAVYLEKEAVMNKQKAVSSNLQEKTQFLEEQNKCPLCRGDLDIYVEWIPSTHSLREEARCLECMALSRVENHVIH